MLQATLLSQLSSPYIVHYTESGRSSDDGVYWFVMELLVGDPLDSLLELGGPWSEVDVVKV